MNGFRRISIAVVRSDRCCLSASLAVKSGLALRLIVVLV